MDAPACQRGWVAKACQHLASDCGRCPQPAARLGPAGRRTTAVSRCRDTAVDVSSRPSGLAEDAIEVRAAHGALRLGHPGALGVHLDFSGGFALRLALDAVVLTAPSLRHRVLLAIS